MGTIPEEVDICGSNAKPGDQIIISGTVADHGVAVLTQREGLTFHSSIESDTAPLNHMVARMLSKTNHIHVLRDPTRGGVATTLNEIALGSGVGIRLYEDQIPVKDEVTGICELLGMDPLYLANEGILLAFVKADLADDVLTAVKEEDIGNDACIVGEVVSDFPGQVFMETLIGGTRIVDMLSGNPLPRIC